LIIITALITMACHSGGRPESLTPRIATGKRHDASRSRPPGYKRRDPRGIPPCGRIPLQETHMLKWAIIFAIVSLVTGWLGFGGVAGVTATIAKVLFVCFLILFLLAVLAVIGVINLF
jgi:uncharacterized membrane protein YtjA (UPF0391 family)